MLLTTSPILAVLFALLLGALIIASVGVNPLAAYQSMVKGAFGSPRALTQAALRAVPLLLISLGLILAFRSRIWNIGAEGQLYMGAWVATLFALSFPSLPPAVMLAGLLLAGFVGGAVWGLVPALLRAYLGANEIVTSLLLNYVAIFWVSYQVRLPMKDPTSFLPQSAVLPTPAALPVLPGTRLHMGVVLALALIPIIAFILWRTPLGYRLRVVGSNPDAARFAGINVPLHIIIVMVISGGLAGAAGMIEVAGVHHRLIQDLSPGFGFTAIVVALLGQLHPAGALLAAYFFASLVIGADSMQRVVGLPVALTEVIQALVVLFVLASEVVRRRR
ncbi:MAG: ABC transporter permease [Anaerolineae bacterium]